MSASKPASSEGYRPISDYGIIGDTRGMALVNRDGGIDYCSLPFLNSPAFFLKILDNDKGGSFGIHPTGDYTVERRYLDHTNVLETTFTTEHGEVELLDCFVVPPTQAQEEEPPHQILRLVQCASGEVEMRIHCRVTPDFARQESTCAQHENGDVEWGWDGGRIWLAGNWPVEVDDEGVVSCTRTMRTGDRLVAILADHRPDSINPSLIRRQINDAVNFWRAWVRECPYFGMHHDMVIRSALTLKLLTFRPAGSIVAAPTTSLPEEIGGVRNWDYRFCWLRDASLTLWSFGLIGFYDEAQEFMHWIEGLEIEKYGLQIMYGLNGERELTEETLEHLAGYRNSRPVRTGNAAYNQQQLDIYGEVLDTAYLFYDVWNGLELYPPGADPLRSGMWELLRSLADTVVESWMEKDQGLWEVRGGPQHFTHSKVMCWVALDRAIKMAEHFQLPANLDTWKAERKRIRQTVYERSYNEEIGAFTQTFDGEGLDASVLLMPMVHFIRGDDPRMVGTVEAIQERLMSNGLVHRYEHDETDEGLPGSEGAFTLCSFWMVDNLVFGGKLREARELFASLIGHANDLGLYSEEIDSKTGEFLGNFPQAFTHMALINAAVNIDKAEQQRAAGSTMPLRPGVDRP